MSMEWVKLGDCCTITSSKRVFANQYVDSGIPFYRSKEIIERRAFKEISEPLYISKDVYDGFKTKFGVPVKGDILLTSVGTLGIPYLVKSNEEFYFKDGNLTWMKNFTDRIDSEYLYYWLSSSFGKSLLLQRAIGSSQAAITIEILKKYKLLLPLVYVQHRIASILSIYDSLIENNTKRIRLLEKMAENLYKEWFVRFRFPGHENVEMENGLPKGWKVMHIKDIATLKSGFAFKSEWFVSEGCGVAKIKDIGETFMDLSNLSYVCEDNCKKAQRFILKEGMLTIALTGATIGKISIVPKHSTCIYTNQRLGKFFVENQPIDSLPFLYCLFSQESMVQDIINLANSSSAQPNISPEQINNIKFTCDEKIIDKYNQMLKGYFQIMIDLHCQNSLLARQRDLLLPRLMSGKLEVKVKA